MVSACWKEAYQNRRDFPVEVGWVEEVERQEKKGRWCATRIGNERINAATNWLRRGRDGSGDREQYKTDVGQRTQRAAVGLGTWDKKWERLRSAGNFLTQRSLQRRRESV